MASSAPEPILAKMEVFLRAPRAPAAAHRAGWYEGWGLCAWGWDSQGNSEGGSGQGSGPVLS